MNIGIKFNSLSIKTLAYLISFSVITLLLLWIIQTGFFKIFYERYQINNIKSVAKKIANHKGELGSQLEALAYESDVCIELHQGIEIIGFNILNKDCLLRSNNRDILNAKANLYHNNDADALITIENPLNNSKSLIYGLRVDNNTYVFLNTKLEDVNSTSAVLMNQLIYVTFAVIILAVFVSIFISKMINKPILKITNKAKMMAGGNFDFAEEDYGIAEINDLNRVLNYACHEIKNTDELRRDLMASVSHDLKTPLTMIKAYVEMARDINSSNKSKRADNLSVIISETDRLNILVNDLLNLSKLESINEEINIENYDLVEAINEILKRYEIIKETEKYKFELNLPKLAIVAADKNKIDQVLYNLINNAINYTGKDLTVKIKIKENRNSYLVEIIDTGKGISKDDLPLIWTKYYKEEKNHRRNVVGTGLGLAIVKNILTKHNFRYGVESEKGKGTNFYFYIKKGKII